VDGGLIQRGYANKPGYFAREDFFRKSKFKPQGKNSTSPFFQNGNRRQSMYLAGGYAQLRQLHGLQTDKVDLMFTGSLMTSITTGNYRGKTVLGFIDFHEINKARGAEHRYGKRIFEPTTEEITAVEKLVETQLSKIQI